jgi:phytanoyl-CoA hydroxylase
VPLDRSAPLADSVVDGLELGHRLARDGWCVVDARFTPEECSSIETACAARRWPAVSADLVAWIADPRWAAIVLSALGPDVRVVREQVVTKAPLGPGEVPWHQDDEYSLVAGEQLTCFVALDDITPDNGCLWMATGSHRRGRLDHVPVGYLRTIAGPVEDPVVAVPLAQGSVAVFSSLTLHRSGPNRTPGTRPAWMVQFCRADATDAATGGLLDGCPLVAIDGTWLDHPRR